MYFIFNNCMWKNVLVCDICTFKRICLNGATKKVTCEQKSEKRGVHTWYCVGENANGYFKRNVCTFSNFFFFLLQQLCYNKTDKLTWLHLNPTRGYKTQTCDEGYFYYCSDRATDTQVRCLHSHALIKLLFDKIKRFRKSSLHIWREVPFTRHKETGRRKRKRRTETRMTQHFNHKRATSSLKTQQGSGTDIAPKVPLLLIIYNKVDILGYCPLIEGLLG